MNEFARGLLIGVVLGMLFSVALVRISFEAASTEGNLRGCEQTCVKLADEKEDRDERT